MHRFEAAMAVGPMEKELVLPEIRLWLVILFMTLIAFVLQERFNQPGVGEGT
jgi:hypothetical protein